MGTTDSGIWAPAPPEKRYHVAPVKCLSHFTTLLSLKVLTRSASLKGLGLLHSGAEKEKTRCEEKIETNPMSGQPGSVRKLRLVHSPPHRDFVTPISYGNIFKDKRHFVGKIAKKSCRY